MSLLYLMYRIPFWTCPIPTQEVLPYFLTVLDNIAQVHTQSGLYLLSLLYLHNLLWLHKVLDTVVRVLHSKINWHQTKWTTWFIWAQLRCLTSQNQDIPSLIKKYIVSPDLDRSCSYWTFEFSKRNQKSKKKFEISYAPRRRVRPLGLNDSLIHITTAISTT